MTGLMRTLHLVNGIIIRFVLDVKILFNNEKIINLEMQVVNQKFWTNCLLSHLCSIFQNLKNGNDYSQIKPAYHISILDLSPFSDYPEFYATNKMMNIKKHYIYNDNFILNVLDLSYISHSKLWKAF